MRKLKLLLFIFLLVIFSVSGCRKGEPGADWVGSERYISKSVFACPYPARDKLPFHLKSSGFRHPSDVENAKKNNIISYSTPDYPSNELKKEVKLEGVIGYGNGILINAPIADEYVSLWWYDGVEWKMIDRQLTDDSGKYTFTVGNEVFRDWGDYVFYIFLEGDSTCTTQIVSLHPQGSKFIVTDIDGTLTKDDQQILLQIQDPSYVPESWDGAVDVMNGYSQKGYYIIYLTARPHALELLTKAWLKREGYPPGIVHTAPTFVYGDSAAQYKREFLEFIVRDLGWDIVAAHGNAESDIEAYKNVGIPDNRIFIIGENAGKYGTTPVNNYKDFLNSDFFRNLPVADQPDR